MKFFCIFSSNLDEFFEVRVAGLKQQMESDVVERSAGRPDRHRNLRAVHEPRARAWCERQYRCWRERIAARAGRKRHSLSELRGLVRRPTRAWLENFYRSQVRPVLTPLGLDPAHPFPQLLNKSLNIIVQLEMTAGGRDCAGSWRWCRCRACCRAWSSCRATMSGSNIIFLGDFIGHYLADLFPATKILGYWNFRVTRNSELYIDEEETANLLKAVENELHNRRKGDAVRLEVEQDCPEDIRHALLGQPRADRGRSVSSLTARSIPTRLMAIHEGDHSPELRDPPFVAPVAAALAGRTGSFRRHPRSGDVLLHHPYENFQQRGGLSASRPPPTRMCWPSSKRFIARAAIRRSSAR